MALKVSHKMSKDLKQNRWESRQSSAAPGEQNFLGRAPPWPWPPPRSPASLNTHSRTQIQSSFTTHVLCVALGLGGTGLPGRLLDLHNKTPISP